MQAIKIALEPENRELKKTNDYRWLDDCPPGVDIDHWIETYFKPWNETIKGFKIKEIK